MEANAAKEEAAKRDKVIGDVKRTLAGLMQKNRAALYAKYSSLERQ